MISTLNPSTMLRMVPLPLTREAYIRRKRYTYTYNIIVKEDMV